MMEKKAKDQARTRQELKQRRKTGVSLLLAFMMAMSLVVVAPAQLALAAPVTISGGDTITTNGTYVVDGSNPGVITINDGLTQVILQGTGIASSNAISGISFAATGATGVGIELQNLYIASPSGSTPIFDLRGAMVGTGYLDATYYTAASGTETNPKLTANPYN